MKHRIVLTIAALAGGYFAFFRPQAEARPDVVSAASITVGTANVTATTVTINYSKDKYNYGTRTLCYDPAPAKPTHNCTTKNASGNQGSFNVTGLKASTQYNYSVRASDGRHADYTSSGTFTTLAAPVGIVAAPRPANLNPPIPGLSVDVSGRKLGVKHAAKAFRAPLPRD
jgi:hypothetical protein